MIKWHFYIGGSVYIRRLEEYRINPDIYNCPHFQNGKEKAQDWKDQAKKNRIDIIESGKYQFCGAPLKLGVSQCVGIAGTLSHRLSHNPGITFMAVFFC